MYCIDPLSKASIVLTPCHKHLLYCRSYGLGIFGQPGTVLHVWPGTVLHVGRPLCALRVCQPGTVLHVGRPLCALRVCQPGTVLHVWRDWAKLLLKAAHSTNWPTG